MRRAGIDTSGSIFNNTVQLLVYADDIDIIVRNPETVKDVYTRLRPEAKQIGLTMNAMKTKYQVYRKVLAGFPIRCR